MKPPLSLAAFWEAATATLATPATLPPAAPTATPRTVATVATVTVASPLIDLPAMAIAQACRLVGVDAATLPDRLRADLLATGDTSPDYLAALIRADLEWEGWDGRADRPADYAPGGRHYKADP
jgi:hypothetical protein